ncbi:partitioning defective 3 homolog isoform X3 [Zootermopsis nevadensis]|uniref:partitioning defective 3 homolog isoform X3 n=1 Tax=Zootermopsis nevadensis TaxID=136037 RepID=UPI000B8E4D5B|nr:partitioning defective 3 homolog isoform X3 [Zootermopsis nevadensis]
MFEGCHHGGDSGGSCAGPRCTDVAEKLAQLFGWRQTYKVEKLQRSLAASVARRNSLLQQQQQQLRIQAQAGCAAEPMRKSTDSWVVVHNLQSQSDGGILDPDDRLNDVADDREQIIANFEDGDGQHHGGGDGASGSSVGTGSPDIFQSENSKFQPLSRTDIEVTGEQIASGLIAAPLQVRRGSEPALNQLVPAVGGVPPPVPGTGTTGCASAGSGSGAASAATDPSKRWSATPIIVDDEDEVKEKRSSHRKEGSRGGKLGNGYLSSDWSCLEKVTDEEECSSSGFTRFVRDGSNRLSMQFLGDGAGGFRWADAAETAAITSGPAVRGQSKSLPRDHRRKEPLGQANSTSPVLRTAHHHSHSHVVHDSDIEDDLNSESVEYVVMHNESGPLGIHVVPDYDRLGKDRGLLVQGIEPGGRIDRDGRLVVYDRIIEINGQNLLNMPFQRVQEIFKDSLRCPELQLRVIKHHSSAMDHTFKKPPPPVFPRSIRGLDDRENIAMVEGEERPESMRTKIATVSPTKKVSPAPRNTATSLQTANTRKIGRKIELELTKGVYGLGFSITTRDNPAGGNCPIYIKNILPKGAAVEDGRLKPGDRLLEVNGVEMTGKTQSEAVSVLRNAPQGSKVSIVVSRQEDSSTSPRLPRQIVAPESTGSDTGFSPEAFQQSCSLQENLVSRSSHIHEPPEKVNDDGMVFPWKHREILTFDIPVHDTEKAGLGVSVKGKTSASHSMNHGNGSPGSSSVDLGIFVKSVLHGGAASRDGRLRTNDQLLNVNGISLLAQSNSDAMETLRRAMLHTEGPIPGVISLTIARRASSPGPHSLSNGLQHSQSGHDSVSSLLTSSSGTETSVCINSVKSENEAYTPDNSGTSENSDNTVIFLPYKDETDHSRESSHLSAKSSDNCPNNGENVSSRNPVIDRLTGHVATQNPNPMRNESYYRATLETWNATVLLSGGAADKLTSPTVNLPSGEMVLIEEEYTPQNLPTVSHSHRIGKSLPEKAPPCQRGAAEPDGRGGLTGTFSSGGPASDQSSDIHAADITYASQLSLEEAAGFTRDAFGRQSMSEKRHATLDAKHTDTYQRNKKLREERERLRHMQLQQQQLNDQKRAELQVKNRVKPNREIIASSMIRANSIESIISVTRSQADSERSDVHTKNEFGPSLGMKKSSSLESLQTMVQEIQMQEDSDPAYTYRNAQGAVRVIRGRGCNESFRAAVDRSYEAPLSDLRSRIEMETLAEEDGPPTVSVPVDCGPGMCPSAFGSVRGGPRQSSLNAILDNKNKPGKKKPGLFRGIGSMFRFGKHRKTLDVPLQLALQVEQEEMEGGEGSCGREEEREAARRAAQEEQQRIQEQYRRLMQRQIQLESQISNNLHEHSGTNASSEPGGPLPVGVHHSHHRREGSTSSASSQASAAPGGPGGQSRTERIHQLRAQHQRRHAERRGQYPMDDREERYEEVIRQRLEQPEFSNTQQQAPVRSASYDLYGEMTRPGSRAGITDPARFSHYVNYEEIQQHLSKRKEQLSEVQIMQMRLQVQHQRFKVEEESRRQQHYHSQRRDNRESHQRPVSNFYEYESVQGVMQSSQHRDDVRSNLLQDEIMRSSQNRDEVMRPNQLRDDGTRSNQYRDENKRSKQHRDEVIRTIQHRDETMRSSQHREESQKHRLNKDDILRTSQHQHGTTITVDNNSNSLQRRMQLQDNKGANNKNNNSANSYQHPYQSSTSSKYSSSSNTHVVNVNGNNHHMRTSHTHDIDQQNNRSGSNGGVNGLPTLPLVHNIGPSNHHTHGNRGVNILGSKINNITGRTQGPFVTHVTIGQQTSQTQPSGSKV